MSKIGPKELALKAQRETNRPRGTARLAHLAKDLPIAAREAGEDAGIFKTKVGKPSRKKVQQAKAKMAVMKAPSPKDELTVALGAFVAKGQAAQAAVDKLTLPKDGSIPEFLKRTETEEQAMNRRKKNAKPDTSAGVTLAPPLSVQKAIAKDLADEPTEVDPFAIAKDLRDHAPLKKAKAKKLPKPDPMEMKLAEAVDLMKTDSGRALAVAAMKGDKVTIVENRGPGLARLRKSPKAETIRKTIVAEQKKATTVKRKNGAAAKAFTDENVKTAAAMIKRKSGALSSELQKACHWEPVMVRRFVRDIARKKLGMSVVCDRSTGKDSTYRVK